MDTSVVELLRDHLGEVMFDPDAARTRAAIESCLNVLNPGAVRHVFLTRTDPNNDSSDVHVLIVEDRRVSQLTISQITRSVSITGWSSASIRSIRFQTSRTSASLEGTVGEVVAFEAIARDARGLENLERVASSLFRHVGGAD